MTIHDIGYAITSNSREILLKAIDGGEDVNGTSGTLPFSHLHRCVINNRYDFIEILVQRGADVHKLDPKGRTPLLTALVRGDLQAVQTLVALGAELRASENDGKSLMQELVDTALTKYYSDSAYPDRTLGILEGCKWLIENDKEWARLDETGAHPIARATPRPDFAAALASLAARNTIRAVAVSAAAKVPQNR
jgi:ankyrin repeat protein